MFSRSRSIGLAILAALGAYVPRVKMIDPVTEAEALHKRKRRNRPLMGRGNYGRNLKAHFDQRGICWSSKPNKIRARYGRAA